MFFLEDFVSLPALVRSFTLTKIALDSKFYFALLSIERVLKEEFLQKF